jgi:hypothetical protein
MTTIDKDTAKRMRLYISQPAGDGVRCRAFAIYNERGEKLPCVTSATIIHDIDNVARVSIDLVVDGRNVVFGDPPDVPALSDPGPPPEDRDRKKSGWPSV